MDWWCFGLLWFCGVLFCGSLLWLFCGSFAVLPCLVYWLLMVSGCCWILMFGCGGWFVRLVWRLYLMFVFVCWFDWFDYRLRFGWNVWVWVYGWVWVGGFWVVIASLLVVGWMFALLGLLVWCLVVLRLGFDLIFVVWVFVVLVFVCLGWGGVCVILGFGCCLLGVCGFVGFVFWVAILLTV